MEKLAETRKQTKKMRSSQAGILTRQVNKSIKAMSEERSKRHLRDCSENIRGALDSLSQTNNLYIAQLETKDEIGEAEQWFSARKETAELALADITQYLENKHIPSVTQDSSIDRHTVHTSTVTSLSESLSVKLEAEQAELALHHAHERARLMETEAEIQTRKAKLQVKEMMEMAELKARKLKEIVEATDLKPGDEVDPHELPVVDRQHRVGTWLEEQSLLCLPHEDRDQGQVQVQGQCGGNAVTGAQERQAMVDNAARQSRLNPNAAPWTGSTANIDGWIDLLVPGQETILGAAEIGVVGKQLDTTDSLLVSLVRMNCEKDLPPIKLPKFDGSPLVWPKFIELFYLQVHVKPGLTDNRRMDLLQSHLEGDAKRFVTGMGYSGRYYAEVLQELKRQFGHRNKVAKAYLDKVTTGPGIVPYNAVALRQFYVTVRDCISTLTQLRYLSDITGTDVLMRAARRLPKNRAAQWNRYIAKISKMREPNLYDLRNWLDECVLADFNPYAIPVQADRNALAKDTGKPKSVLKTTVGGGGTPMGKSQSTLSTQKADSASSTGKSKQMQSKSKDTSSQDSQRKGKCVLCEENHHVFRCSEFLNRTVDERRRVVRDNDLCYNCLKPSHRADSCRSSVRCRQPNCNGSHHTLLHVLKSKTGSATVNTTLSAGAGERSSEERQQNSESTSTVIKEAADQGSQQNTKTVQATCIVEATAESHQENQAYFQLVPVYIVGKNGMSKRTVALLDSASEITIVKDTLARELGLGGVRKPLTIQTMSSALTQESREVSFRVKSIDGTDDKPLYVRSAWTVSSNLIHCPSQHIRSEWKHLSDLALLDIEPSQVEILIGVNVPEAHLHLEVRKGLENQPLAVRNSLGWSILGTAAKKRADKIRKVVNLTKLQSVELKDQVQRFWETESFGVKYKDESPLSLEDRRAQHILEETTRLVDGHYEVGMLWREKDLSLPNNYSVAQRRYNSLIKKLNRDDNFRDLYRDTLNGYIAKGQARKLTPAPELHHTDSPSRIWYLPHHGVTNVNKPGKVRVVFDAAATYRDTSLNKSLLCGPGYLNNLFGVIQRFRLYAVALVADIEGMFHQVKVPDADSSALRFLWKEDLQKPGPPDTYEMTVHIFGAADSPTCANYALQRTARDNVGKFSSQAVETVLRDFYMDDLSKSVENSDQGIALSHELMEMLSLGGFRLHKWLSNRKEVLLSTKDTERMVQKVDVEWDKLGIQRTLGLRWNILEDSFVYTTKPKDTSSTKRGVVSMVSSIFDPCGFLAPFVIRAKCLIQDIWRAGLDWDDPLPPTTQKSWDTWRQELDGLRFFRLPRHHQGFTSEATSLSMHVFSDASESAFAAVAFLRYVTEEGRITCSFLAAKTHVAPIKPALSIPRLELQGAVLATRLAGVLEKELQPLKIDTHFWTDSTTVLQYIENESRRFKPFVSNRIAEIRDSSNPDHWHYISTSLNPADCCTRGIRVSSLSVDHLWFKGPDFLLQEEEHWPKKDEVLRNSDLDRDDPEIKHKVNTQSILLTMAGEGGQLCTAKGEDLFSGLEIGTLVDHTHFSSWQALLRRTAWILRAMRNLLSTVRKIKPIRTAELLVEELEEAEFVWVQEVQRQGFPKEIDRLRRDEPVDNNSRLSQLSPFFDGRHLRVGGRLRKARIPEEAKYQLVLPTDHPVVRLLFMATHGKLLHCGTEHLIAQLRQRYWPVNARVLARKVISECMLCRIRRAKPAVPRMADLPISRLSVAAGAFYHSGVDYFGPMQVRIRRTTLKRWGCLFTCLGTRAVHIELADSLETDDFLLCLRNFIGRRGQPKSLSSDNGTNFRGADAELKQCLEHLDQSRISSHLTPQGIQWFFNPPAAPHFGGAWERLVRSVKVALKATLSNQVVTESVLRTALIEVEATLNSRPLTYNGTDPGDFTALTPNHFLLGRANNAIPVDEFTDREINSRKRWRQAQVIANHVCRRWLKEYLPPLTVRHQWTRDSRPISIGDLVLVVESNLPRGCWELARVEEVYPGDDDRIRAVKVRTSKNSYIRPATKICVLEENVCGDCDSDRDRKCDSESE